MIKAMYAQGLSLDRYRRWQNYFSYRLLEPISPRALRLATAAAIEHHNAAIAGFFLRQQFLRGVRLRELRRLFLWHFAEEIEHKEVVFKLLQRVSRSWTLRALGLVASWATFLLYIGIGTLLLGMNRITSYNVCYTKLLRTRCLGR